MRPVHLDFLDIKNQRRQQSNLVVVFLLVVIVVGMILEHSRIKSQIVVIEDSIARSQGQQSVRQVKPTENDIRKTKQLKLIQQKLNFPWLDLLTSLEVVKQNYPYVTLIAIQPNPSKGEVLITGEVTDLKTLLAFVSSLEKQAIFQDVFLVNQRRLELNDNKGLAFTLKMGWQV